MKTSSISSDHTALITEACRMIEQAERSPSLQQLAQHTGLSSFHFHRLFKQVTGVTPKQYALAQRGNRLRAALHGGGRVTDAIVEAGYSSNSRFYEKADSVLGMEASRYRAGGMQVDIHFALAECSLGSILVAQSPRGICAISLGDDPQALLTELQIRFPNANLIGDDPAFEQVVARVIGFVEAPGIGLDLPLDIRGTAFQQRVWQALRRIPPGSTASYSEIARLVGAPNAVRAVASACAANTLAVAIPCHRVVRTGGSLSGYRWGVARKRALLDRETQSARSCSGPRSSGEGKSA